VYAPHYHGKFTVVTEINHTTGEISAKSTSALTQTSQGSY